MRAVGAGLLQHLVHLLDLVIQAPPVVRPTSSRSLVALGLGCVLCVAMASKEEIAALLAPFNVNMTNLVTTVGNMQTDIADIKAQTANNSEAITNLAKIQQDQDGINKQTQAKFAQMDKALADLKATLDRHPKQVRIDPTPAQSAPSSSTSAPQAGTVPPEVAPRPTRLQVRGFSRGHYEADYQDYYNLIKVRLNDALLLDCEPVYPHCQNFFTLKFSSNDNAFKAKGLLTSSDLPGFSDNRRHRTDSPYITFTRTAQQAAAGRYRSFFYDAMKHHIAGLPLAQGKVVKMKVVTQKLVADVGGEPFELMRLVLSRDGDMKITPMYDSCSDLGIDQATVDQLISTATAKAEADRSAR